MRIFLNVFCSLELDGKILSRIQFKPKFSLVSEQKKYFSICAVYSNPIENKSLSNNLVKSLLILFLGRCTLIKHGFLPFVKSIPTHPLDLITNNPYVSLIFSAEIIAFVYSILEKQGNITNGLFDIMTQPVVFSFGFFILFIPINSS